MLAGLLGDLAGAWITPRDQITGTMPEAPVAPAVDPAARWSGTVYSEVFLALGGVLAAAGVGLLFLPGIGPIIGNCLLITAIALGPLAWWRVTIDERGVRLRCLLPWPVWRITPERIARAEAVTIRRGEFGGWGVRMTDRGTALVYRPGDAVVVHRRDARPLFVVIDDAEGAAATVNAHC